MTINDKAVKEELSVEKVAAIAAAAGINVEDLDRKLDAAEAITLGKAVKAYREQPKEQEKKEDGSVLFWSQNTRHILSIPSRGESGQQVKFEGHILRLEKDEDAELIKMLRRVRSTAIFEVRDEPFEPESDEFMEMRDLLENIVFTGHSKEQSKAGLKAVRAMHTGEELVEMGKIGFDPRRLIERTMRTKSCVRIINNL